MRTIPLLTVPNQSLTFAFGSNRWALRLKDANGRLVIDVNLNDVDIVLGMRICVGTPVLPYEYLQADGNFLFLVDDEELPNWELIGASQQLVFLEPGENVA